MNNKNAIIWFNGEFKKFSECSISLATHGLHYGTSIFEGMRAYNWNIFKFNEHNKRLIRSGEIVDIPVPYSLEILNNVCNEILKKNNLPNAYLRPFAWRGDENLGVVSKKNTVNVAIMAWEWGNYYGKDKITNGLKLCESNWVRPDPRSVSVEAKVGGNYYIGSIIKNKASDDNYDDVLMLDCRGYVAECSSSNVFFIKNNEIYTPIADCFLNGITRQTIFEIANELSIKCNEVRIKSEELNEFQECFVTGTAAEIMPVGEIFDKYHYKNFNLTNKVRNYYLNLVNKI